MTEPHTPIHSTHLLQAVVRADLNRDYQMILTGQTGVVYSPGEDGQRAAPNTQQWTLCVFDQRRACAPLVKHPPPWENAGLVTIEIMMTNREQTFAQIAVMCAGFPIQSQTGRVSFETNKQIRGEQTLEKQPVIREYSEITV